MNLKNFPFEYKIKPSDPDEIQICCPFCEKIGKPPDTKFHLYIHLKKKLFHCFRCSASGKFRSLNQLVRILTGKSQSLFSDWNEVIQDALSYFDNSSQVFAKQTQNNEVINLDVISIQVDKSLTPIAYNYLKSRNLSDLEIEEYQIRVGKSYQIDNKIIRKWKGRVLFPFFENNQVIYVVGRSYTGQEPKYLNSKGSRRDKLFPSRTFRTSEIIVCEGIFDAINAKRTTGIYSVATLGKEITDEQVNIIVENGVKTVYLALDSDLTIEEWQKSIMKFLIKGCKVFPVFLPQGYDVDSVKDKFPYFLEKAIKQDLASVVLFEPNILKNYLNFSRS